MNSVSQLHLTNDGKAQLFCGKFPLLPFSIMQRNKIKERELSGLLLFHTKNKKKKKKRWWTLPLESKNNKHNEKDKKTDFQYIVHNINTGTELKTGRCKNLC